MSSLKLVCPRCKEEKEDLDCLYGVQIEVYLVEGSSKAEYTSKDNSLEERNYRLCGQCVDKVLEQLCSYEVITE